MGHDRLMRRMGLIALLLACLLAVLQLASPAFAAPTYPPLTGRVSDAAGVLPADVAAALESRLKALENSTGTQLVVATVADLEGYEIDEYGVGLLRAWGIGQKGANNGAILLVAPNQRKVRIDVGPGLQGILTDAMTSTIIRNSIIPAFKRGDLPGGIVAGSDATIALLQASPEELAAIAAKAAPRPNADEDKPGWGALIWLIIIVVWVFVSARPGRRGRRRGPVVVWGPGLGGSWSGGGSSGWGGGGSSGGDSFSGGGGWGDGGGASGDW